MKKIKAYLQDENDLKRTLMRISHEIIEKNPDLNQMAIVGIRTRGEIIAQRITDSISKITNVKIDNGTIDVTFYRDDFRRKDTPLIPSITNLDFSIENKMVVLADDVLFTGRTVRSGLDAIMAYGRPAKVELLTLIERRFSHQIPLRPDYIGKSIDTIQSERVTVNWNEKDGKDQVILHTPEMK